MKFFKSFASKSNSIYGVLITCIKLTRNWDIDVTKSTWNRPKVNFIKFSFARLLFCHSEVVLLICWNVDRSFLAYRPNGVFWHMMVSWQVRGATSIYSSEIEPTFFMCCKIHMSYKHLSFSKAICQFIHSWPDQL